MRRHVDDRVTEIILAHALTMLVVGTTVSLIEPAHRALTVPPLRERREDVPVLARYFIDRFCKDLKKPP